MSTTKERVDAKIKTRKRSVTVDVEAEVDISDFSTDDLLAELIQRASHEREKKTFDLDMLHTIYEYLDMDSSKPVSALSILDIMKRDYLLEVIDQYTLDDIEKALPAK